jgi:hypothetical protein
MRALMLLLIALVLSGCAMTGAPMTEEARCVQEGGRWRANSCDPGVGDGGGGGGY